MEYVMTKSAGESIGESTSGQISGYISEWAECPVCGTETKSNNLEEHVREKHSKEYMNHYPGAPSRGWMPCDECWEWFHRDATVKVDLKKVYSNMKYTEVQALQHHVANEHPECFDEMFPSESLLDAYGLVAPAWPPCGEDDPEANFIWRDDDIDYNAAALLLSDKVGTEIDEATAREHTHKWFHDLRLKTTEYAEIRVKLSDVGNKPTEIEQTVMEECEEGAELTAKELAEECGYTPRGIRKRAEDMVINGVLEVVNDGRPKVYRVTGGSRFNEMQFDDSDPTETDWEPETFESLYGYQYEDTGAY